jgi:hypothetical protein
MSLGNWRGAETDKAELRAAPEPGMWSDRVNRRRPWYQRPMRRSRRQVPVKRATLLSPLRLFLGVNLVGGFMALMFGFIAISLVGAIAALGCWACQNRHPTRYLI